jgi:hypothetical protein
MFLPQNTLYYKVTFIPGCIVDEHAAEPTFVASSSYLFTAATTHLSPQPYDYAKQEQAYYR